MPTRSPQGERRYAQPGHLKNIIVYTVLVFPERWQVVKNITLSADEELIEAARAEHTTLNEQFREWLAVYARETSRIQRYGAVVVELKGKIRVG